MTTLILLRHGRSTANTAGVLAGRTPGVGLDEQGQAQAAQIAGRLSGVRIDRIVSSPMDRCRQTVAPLTGATGLEATIDDGFAEVDYGDWTGRKLSELTGEPLWRTVQVHPSAATFPGGEAMAAMSARAVDAVRRQLASAGADEVVLVCSHGDVIKAILADALGLHLDGFQRIVVAPASLSVVRYTEHRPFVEKVNDSVEFPTLRPAQTDTAPSDAVPGGTTS